MRRLGVLRFRTEDQLAKLTKGEAQRMITVISSGAVKKAPTLSETQGRTLRGVIDV